MADFEKDMTRELYSNQVSKSRSLGMFSLGIGMLLALGCGASSDADTTKTEKRIRNPTPVTKPVNDNSRNPADKTARKPYKQLGVSDREVSDLMKQYGLSGEPDSWRNIINTANSEARGLVVSGRPGKPSGYIKHDIVDMEESPEGRKVCIDIYGTSRFGKYTRTCLMKFEKIGSEWKLRHVESEATKYH